MYNKLLFSRKNYYNSNMLLMGVFNLLEVQRKRDYCPQFAEEQMEFQRGEGLATQLMSGREVFGVF